ncbi:MAG: ParB/RepB/Spo0J family partition protein [Geminicoccaceae bacterium]|nr:MAG: ParB/RepB/Spo0J family partition protein [Geminicoccaceae bacterium]
MSGERKRGLGRGLEALLADHTGAEGEGARTLPIEYLVARIDQPRRKFGDADLEELAASIRSMGVLQPLLVRPLDEFGEQFQIIAGERRWRAAAKAGLGEVPVIVRHMTDTEALEAALLENVQRENLTPLEEAEGYQRLIEECGYTQEALAQRLGKSRPYLSNLLRLLGLPDTLKTYVDYGDLTAGHARALLPARDPIRLAKIVIERGLNVRQTEALVKAENSYATTPRPRDPDLVDLEHRLTNVLGLKVEVKTKGTGGRLTIAFSTPEQLDNLLAKLG